MSGVDSIVSVLPQEGLFMCTCDVLDTQDPETKIFQFKEWPGIPPGWLGPQGGIEIDSSGPKPIGRLRYIVLYSGLAPEWREGCKNPPRPGALGQDGGYGKRVARYTVTAKLGTPPGYVGAYEGTTNTDTNPNPVTKKVVAEPVSNSIAVADMILSALEPVGRMALRDLRRKTNAARLPQFDVCLKALADEGVLTLEPDPEYPTRLWAVLKSVETDITNPVNT